MDIRVNFLYINFYEFWEGESVTRDDYSNLEFGSLNEYSFHDKKFMGEESELENKLQNEGLKIDE